MKPFITNSLENGRHMLRFQLDGMERCQLNNLFLSKSIIAYSLPEGHTLDSAWLCRFYLDSGDIFEFSSACTEVDGWEELGSLNIAKVDSKASENLFNRTKVNPFFICLIECLVYENTSVFAECGIVLRDSLGGEVIIAAGISPGSVSVQAPFTTLPFEPELSMSDYRRMAI